MKPAWLYPEAAAEFREAAAWYKERSPDVARRFLQNVRALTRTVTRMPLRFPVLLEPALDPLFVARSCMASPTLLFL